MTKTILQTIIETKHITLQGFLVVLFTPMFQFIDKYLFSDWETAIFLIVAIAIDSALGVYLALKNKEFTFQKMFNKMLEKTLIYMSWLVLIHILVSFKIKGEINNTLSWFEYVGYTVIFTKEAISVVKKIGSLKPDLVPDFLIDRLERYNEESKYFRKNQENEI